jgi:lipopolysaccharide transport system ATP-binding protein
MSDISIRIENLGKKYRLRTPSGNDRLSEVLHHLGRATISAPRRWFSGRRADERDSVRAPSERAGEFWALRDVSFDVHRGEVVGIIGRNGAGKSTLLKILSRITEPTTGRFGLCGRVGSLLEVGTGFHSELTGRENIFLNGAVLGMRRREIRQKFDEIVAFAEIEQFLDTPVKRYSSGMYVRLAFAIAAHLLPDILIIDEVLAVGDAVFQKKCLGKMSEVSRSGRTVLFVSHNDQAVRNLCQRAVWLQDGRVQFLGPSELAVKAYWESSSTGVTEQLWASPEVAPGNHIVRLHRAKVYPSGTQQGNVITISTPFVFEFQFWNLVPNTQLSPSLIVFDQERVPVFASYPVDNDSCLRPSPAGLFRAECLIPQNLLNEGAYTATLILVLDRSRPIFQFDDILRFNILDDSKRDGWYGKHVGVVRPKLEWTFDLTSN